MTDCCWHKAEEPYPEAAAVSRPRRAQATYAAECRLGRPCPRPLVLGVASPQDPADSPGGCQVFGCTQVWMPAVGMDVHWVELTREKRKPHGTTEQTGC